LSAVHHVWHAQWSRRGLTSTFTTLSPSAVGTFDIMLFTVLLYHMRHPLLALERAASVCGDLLILETVLDAAEVTRAGDGLLPRCRAEARSKHWWGPNRLCVEAMLRDVGFKQITYTPSRSQGN